MHSVPGMDRPPSCRQAPPSRRSAVRSAVRSGHGGDAKNAAGRPKTRTSIRLPCPGSPTPRRTRCARSVMATSHRMKTTGHTTGRTYGPIRDRATVPVRSGVNQYKLTTTQTTGAYRHHSSVMGNDGGISESRTRGDESRHPNDVFDGDSVHPGTTGGTREAGVRDRSRMPQPASGGDRSVKPSEEHDHARAAATTTTTAPSTRAARAHIGPPAIADGAAGAAPSIAEDGTPIRGPAETGRVSGSCCRSPGSDRNS